MENSTNHILLRGSLNQLPQYSHDNHSSQFYRFFLDIPRLSGTVDTLPIIARSDLIENLDPFGGQMLTVEGQIRSHNYRLDGNRHLMIFVFASSIAAEDGPPCNEVILEGPLCKQPTFRKTPLGREICDGMLAVPRAYHRADYLPCIFWGSIAKEVSYLEPGNLLALHGRMQSREYTKQTEEGLQQKTAYEISALTANTLIPQV